MCPGWPPTWRAACSPCRRPARPRTARPVDVSDPAVRRALAEDEFGTCTPHAGLTQQEFLAAVHRVIAELWDDDPRETFQAARRMFASGADRHDIIHTLAETPAAPGGQTGPAAPGGQTGPAAPGGQTGPAAQAAD